MEKIVWQVEYTSLPRIIKYCKKCGQKSGFESSKLFRVNANHKNLDVWLIYNCMHCKTTWKRELYSRAKVSKLSQEILEKLQNNDCDLAYHYTMECYELSKQGFELIIPDYHISGEDVDLDMEYEIELISDYNFDIKLTNIMKEKLRISNTRINELIKSGKIKFNKVKKIKKCRLQKKQTIYFK